MTIAEVEELVEVGELDGDHIRTPGVFVQTVVPAREREKSIDRRKTRQVPSA